MKPIEEVRAMLDALCDYATDAKEPAVAVMAVQLAHFMRALKIAHPVAVPDRCVALLPNRDGAVTCMRGQPLDGCGTACQHYKSAFVVATEETVPEITCRYRGKLLQEGSCKCGDGRVWECLSTEYPIGRQIGKSCKASACKGYAAAE